MSVRIHIQRRVAPVELDVHGLQDLGLPLVHLVSFLLLHLARPPPQDGYASAATQHPRKEYRDGDGVVNEQSKHELDQVPQKESERSLVLELDLVQLIVYDALLDLLGVAPVSRVVDARP